MCYFARTRTAGVLANLSVLLAFVVAALLNSYNESLYYLSVQEDEVLEWATFWGFIVAAGIYFSSACALSYFRRCSS
jgi:hypothetical protein